ncbi:MAG: NUDIX domain-containing protein [archaeon]
MNLIPEKDYKKILETMPLCCTDVIIHQNGKVLLVKRKEEPAKNEWWVPGGRLHKNIKLEDGIKSKAVEEVGFEIKVEKILGVYEFFFDKGIYPDLKTGTHGVSVCFLAKPKDDNPQIKIDNTSENYRWFDKIEKNFHPYLKKMLKDSKIIE